jgi:hypothetical protein
VALALDLGGGALGLLLGPTALAVGQIVDGKPSRARAMAPISSPPSTPGTASS